MNRVAKLLREAREKKGMTQEQLGQKLKYASGHQYVSNWERGASPPPFAKLREINKELEVKPQEFIDAYLQDFRERLEQVL